MLIDWLSGRPLRFLALFAGSALALAANSPAAFPQDAPRSQIVGIWRGNSVCAVANSPCHDEVNVYRFSDIPAKPGHFSCKHKKDGRSLWVQQEFEASWKNSELQLRLEDL
jgi:hypothetical protein